VLVLRETRRGRSETMNIHLQVMESAELKFWRHGDAAIVGSTQDLGRQL